ncbi:MAG: paraquat-inducible protein A [Bdellovibrionaceae bacterium]|nr:paraquat-inducible protein A [Bdellovibrio sp.]
MFKRHLKLLISLAILICSVVLCQQIVIDSVINQQNKQDYAEVNHIKYGLFSINQWKEKLEVILADEISKLRFNDINQAELKKMIEGQLDTLIDSVANKISESNKGSTKGWMKQKFINAFVDINDIKKGIPEYADAIIAKMKTTKTERKVKVMLKSKVEQYFDETFESQDLTRLNAILARTQTPDIDQARAKLDQDIAEKEKFIYEATWILIFIAIMMFVMNGFSKKAISAQQFTIMLLTLLVLLLAGVTTPMIDMEAKISEMSFVLMDHPVSFLNQVLYFQSKSILDVFWIMITHKDLQMKIVGILVVMFSVVFPLSKMICSLTYYFDYRKSRANKWVQFFVLKSGKWSMSDVLVVAIFMAYIGFNGIIASQFGNFNAKNPDMVILTTNGTSLQPGFYIFLAYAILSLILSNFLVTKIRIKETHAAAV